MTTEAEWVEFYAEAARVRYRGLWPPHLHYPGLYTKVCEKGDYQTVDFGDIKLRIMVAEKPHA